jgi:serine/threonine protein kinase
MESVGHHSFSGCRSLNAVQFLRPSKLNVIGNQAFAGSALLEVTIPSSVPINVSTFPLGCVVQKSADSPSPDHIEDIVILEDYDKVSDLTPHVRKYRSKETGRIVAARGVWMPESMKSSHSLNEILVRELESWTTISCHPSIVPLIGYSLPGRRTGSHIVTEFMEHGDLHEVIRDSPCWWTPTAKAMAIVGLIRGMEFAHSCQIIHRDLNPWNLLFDSHYHLRINDFQSSRIASLKSQFTHQLGNGSYTAPEMFTATEYDEKVDVFSFGMILYEILSNVPVFESNLSPYQVMVKIKQGERAVVSQTFQEWVARLIGRCWDKNPANRPSFHDIAGEIVEHGYQFECRSNIDVPKVSQFDHSVDLLSRTSRKK